MKLLAFAERPLDSPTGATHLGLLTSRGILDLTPLGFEGLAGVIRDGEAALDRIASHALGAARDATHLDPATVSLRAPLPAPGKIVCIGLNYHDHCREQGIDPPAYPMLFAKFANAVNHPGANVVRPAATERLDLECELGVVIGRHASHVDREAALEAVFGYTIVNDVTMRDLQREDRQWLRAKGTDGFAPMGPVVVTRDELADPQHLAIRSSVNGESWQVSSTAEMVFDVPTLVAFVSRFIVLEPGDVIATGTPAGVGVFQDPPRFLHGGDVMRCEIEGIGVLENPVVDEQPRVPDHDAAAGLGSLLAPVAR